MLTYLSETGKNYCIINTLKYKWPVYMLYYLGASSISCQKFCRHYSILHLVSSGQ